MHSSPSRRTEPLAPRGEPTAEVCPQCSLPRDDRDRFCEGCSFDFEASNTSWANTEWVAEIAVDRGYYDRLAPHGVPFPTDRHSAVLVPLGDGDTRIGRRGATGAPPAIDLSGPLADPGVSRYHAMITRSPDGGRRLHDTDSTNGTTLNDDENPIDPTAVVELADGDRIHLGAWTTITIRRRLPRSP